MKLKPYPVYKDSGVPWLGEVPEHWDIERLKSSMSNVIQQTAERHDTDLYIALEHVESWTGRIRLAGEDLSFDSQVKRFQAGDVLFGKLRPYLAKVARPRTNGVCVGEFFVLRPQDCRATTPYMEQLLRSKPIIDAVSSSTFGAKMPRADWHFFGGMTVTLPPLPEQAAIVRFLDHADRRIRRYIRAKQKLIKLLEEQKQAIIHRAVTRGLNPSVRLKPSGVEWLGEVPEHWKVVRLARVIADGPRNGISPPVDERGTIESFSISAICGGKVDVRERDKKYISGDKASLESTYCLLRGDVLLVRGNGNIRLVGKAGLVEHDMPNRVYPDLLMRLRLTHRCLPEFLVALLNCPAGRNQIETAARTAVGTFKINNQQVRQLCFALPPATEQQRIVDWLSDELSAIKAALYRADDEIDLLREYRTRLIADVVTGELDVREAAAQLSDEDPLLRAFASSREPEPDTDAVPEETQA